MPSSPEFNTEDLRFWVGSPDTLSMMSWKQMQTVAEEAMLAVSPDEEVAWAIHKSDTVRFARGRRDPQVEVQAGRLNEGEFSNLGVAAAFNDKDKIVGYSYSADNTSGNPAFVRRLKMNISPALPVPKVGHRRYAWIRETMVHPEYQHRGIAHVLGYLSIAERHPKQPVAIYEWEPASRIVDSLQNLGLERTGAQIKQPYGAGSKPKELVRFAASRAQTVMDNIHGLSPSAAQAIENAQKSRRQYL